MPVTELSKLVDDAVPSCVVFHRVKEVWHDQDGYAFTVKIARKDIAYQPLPAWDAGLYEEPVQTEEEGEKKAASGN